MERCEIEHCDSEAEYECTSCQLHLCVKHTPTITGCPVCGNIDDAEGPILAGNTS